MTFHPDTISKLRSLASKHGHSTPIGSRYSLLAHMIENLPTYQRPVWATHPMQTLPYKIKEITAKLAVLVSGPGISQTQRYSRNATHKIATVQAKRLAHRFRTA